MDVMNSVQCWLQEEMWLCRGQLRYLLILIGRDSGEHSLREGEGARALPNRDRSDRGQLLSALLPDDVDARLVLVHGVQNDLSRERERGNLFGLNCVT